MISKRIANNFCYEDISLIENYEKAVNDQTQTWVCHHRLETDENKSMQQLIDEGRYYNRPANELIFLTHSEHSTLHNKCQSNETRQKRSESKKGEKNPMYGRTGEKNPMYGRTGEKNPMYGRTGEKNPMYGKHHSEETKRRISESCKRKKAAT